MNWLKRLFGKKVGIIQKPTIHQHLLQLDTITINAELPQQAQIEVIEAEEEIVIEIPAETEPKINDESEQLKQRLGPFSEVLLANTPDQTQAQKPTQQAEAPSRMFTLVNKAARIQAEKERKEKLKKEKAARKRAEIERKKELERIRKQEIEIELNRKKEMEANGWVYEGRQRTCSIRPHNSEAPAESSPSLLASPANLTTSTSLNSVNSISRISSGSSQSSSLSALALMQEESYAVRERKLAAMRMRRQHLLVTTSSTTTSSSQSPVEQQQTQQSQEQQLGDNMAPLPGVVNGR